MILIFERPNVNSKLENELEKLIVSKSWNFKRRNIGESISSDRKLYIGVGKFNNNIQTFNEIM